MNAGKLSFLRQNVVCFKKCKQTCPVIKLPNISNLPLKVGYDLDIDLV